MFLRNKKRITCSKKCFEKWKVKTQKARNQKISRSMMKRIQTHNGWNGTHYDYVSNKAGPIHLHSSWEFEVANILDESHYRWIRPKRWFTYFDREGIKRRYNPDFYIHAKILYIEVKAYMPEKQRWKIEQVSKKIKLLLVRTKSEIRNIIQMIDNFDTKILKEDDR